MAGTRSAGTTDSAVDRASAVVASGACTVTACQWAAQVPLAAGFSIEARAENLFDARVEAGISGPGVVERATPRTLWLGLRYRLR